MEKEYEKKCRQYLIEAVSIFVFKQRFLFLPSPEAKQLCSLIQQVIKPVREPGDLPFRETSFREAVDRYFNEFASFSPSLLYPLISYEALCWFGPTFESNPLITLIVARLVDHHQGASYEILDEIGKTGVDSIALQYEQKYRLGEKSERAKVDILYVLSMLSTDHFHWPEKKDTTTLWAQKEKDHLQKYLSQNDDYLSTNISWGYFG